MGKREGRSTNVADKGGLSKSSSTTSSSSTLSKDTADKRQSVSPFLLVVCLLLGVPSSYYAGRVVQQQTPIGAALSWNTNKEALTSNSKHDENSTTFSTSFACPSPRRDELLATATYRRKVMTKIGHDSAERDSTVPQEQELILEEVVFAEPFGQFIEDDSIGDNDDDDGDEEDDDEESEEDPSAIQIIMDIERLDSVFLQDMDQIRQAMLDTTWEASQDHDIAIMSVQCQQTRTQVGGVLCVAILEDGNHMTVRTDPDGRFCSLDLYWARPGHLLHVVPIMEKHFGIGDKPLMSFRQLFRGERDFTGRWSTLENDITDMLLEYKDDFFFKKEIGSLTSNFQQIDIWEGLNPKLQSVEGYERSLLGAEGVDDYYTQHPELFRPNRMLYMDGVMQSSSWGDEAYHEGLVHPAMFAHAEGPKRVAIIGGGEGATLREILKHKSVEVCTMIEIDPGIVEASRVYLPRMNDCSDFGRGNCFDEGRTELRLEDAFGFFLNRFKKEGTVAEELKTDPYGVIVMDALDPDDPIEFAVQMYKDTVFWGTLHEALTDNGILVLQLGMTPKPISYGEQFGDFKNRDNLFRSIEVAGFERMFIYHDTHSDFKFPWSYMVACKSADCEKEWYRNEAEVNLRMHERMLPSKSGQPMLKYFDGATMQSYLRPYTSWQNVHCRKNPLPEECSLFDSIRQAITWNAAFDANTKSDKHGGALVAKTDLREGTAIYYILDSNHGDINNTPAPELRIKQSVASKYNFSTAVADGGAAVLLRNVCGETLQMLSHNLLDDLSGTINPLRDRQSHLFANTVIVTKDVAKGEKIVC